MKQFICFGGIWPPFNKTLAEKDCYKSGAFFILIQYLQRNLGKNNATEENERQDEGEEKGVEEKHRETHLKFTCFVFPSNL